MYFIHTQRTRRSQPRLIIALTCALSFLAASETDQTYTPLPPPEQPSEYGKVILENYSSNTQLGPVVFDHWLHRSKFTCRLCHVDIGFAMRANGTGIAASSIRDHRYCGACHDGKRVIDTKVVFASCSEDGSGTVCNRCHSVGKRGARKFHYWSYTAKLPKGSYGVDWDAAEGEGKITPIDVLDGIATRKTPIPTPPGFSIQAPLSWRHPTLFSHDKHSRWNGCGLCHREIFPTAPKQAVRNSMFLHMEGRYCGACHGKVAFPINNCSQCHPQSLRRVSNLHE